jgi:hypothetical protein
MEAVELNVGDAAWCYVGNHQGKMSKGKVVAVLNLEGWGHKHYVIEISTHVDPLLEVRPPWAVSDSAKKPIGFMRRASL